MFTIKGCWACAGSWTAVSGVVGGLLGLPGFPWFSMTTCGGFLSVELYKTGDDLLLPEFVGVAVRVSSAGSPGS